MVGWWNNHNCHCESTQSFSAWCFMLFSFMRQYCPSSPKSINYLQTQASFDIALCYPLGSRVPRILLTCVGGNKRPGWKCLPQTQLECSTSKKKKQTNIFFRQKKLCFHIKCLIFGFVCVFVCLQGCQLDRAEQFPAVSQPQRHFSALQELWFHHPRPHAAVRIAIKTSAQTLFKLHIRSCLEYVF